MLWQLLEKKVLQVIICISVWLFFLWQMRILITMMIKLSQYLVVSVLDKLVHISMRLKRDIKRFLLLRY